MSVTLIPQCALQSTVKCYNSFGPPCKVKPMFHPPGSNDCLDIYTVSFSTFSPQASALSSHNCPVFLMLNLESWAVSSQMRLWKLWEWFINLKKICWFDLSRRDSKRDSSCFLLVYPKFPAAVPAVPGRIQESGANPNLSSGWQGPHHQGHHLLPPREHTSRKLDLRIGPNAGSLMQNAGIPKSYLNCCARCHPN